jgi:hypothetical protein
MGMPLFFKRFLLVMIGLLLHSAVYGERWVFVGADTEAKFYVDLDSVLQENENKVFKKRGMYTNVLTDEFNAGEPVVFKITEATVEMDCALELNRVRLLEIIDEAGNVKWSSGLMPRQLWLSIRDQGHSRTSFDFVCGGK